MSRASSSPGPAFSTKPAAPASSASSSCRRSGITVRTRTRAPLPRATIRRVASSPPPPGMSKSITTTCGRVVVAHATASSPRPASPTTLKPRRLSSSARRPARKTTLSSTKRMRIGFRWVPTGFPRSIGLVPCWPFSPTPAKGQQDLCGPPGEGVPQRGAASGRASAPRFVAQWPRLRQLPDLDPVPRENGDQEAVALRIVADVGRARHAGHQLHLLTGLIARHGRIIPARHENPPTRDHDAVEPSRALGDDAGRLVLRLPREHRLAAELHDHEALAHGV